MSFYGFWFSRFVRRMILAVFLGVLIWVSSYVIAGVQTFLGIAF